MYKYTISILALVLLSSGSDSAFATSLSQAEVRAAMLEKKLVTRRFGMKITMRYRNNGTVSAEALLGSTSGTWRPSGNRICTTFPSGPAKGTSCVSFRRIGPNRFVSSEGVRFSVVD